MADDLPVRPGLRIPGAELSFSAARSGGPGGQHANKTSSRVTLRWDVRASVALTGVQRARLLERLATRLDQGQVLAVSVDDSRSQHRNREIARERLAKLVRQALHVPKARRATRPSAGARRRRLESKRQRGAVKKLRRTPPGD